MKKIYLLAGDPFLVQERERHLASQIEKKFGKALFRQSYRLSETPLETVLIEARSLPFLYAGQMFVLKEAEVLKSEDLEMLGAYLEHPSEVTFLIFEAFELDKDHKLLGLISHHGEVFRFEEGEKKSETSRFIREKLRQFQKSISPKALVRLEDQIGQSPIFIDSLLEQLIAYAGDQKEITEEMFAAFEEDWRETNAFEWLHALAERNQRKALVMLKQLFREEGDPVSLLGMLHWKLRSFWKVRLLLEEGKPEAAILKACRIWPRQAPLFLRQLKQLSRERIEKALEGLFQLDWKIKTGQVEPELGLETWLVRTTSR